MTPEQAQKDILQFHCPEQIEEARKLMGKVGGEFSFVCLAVGLSANSFKYCACFCSTTVHFLTVEVLRWLNTCPNWTQQAIEDMTDDELAYISDRIDAVRERRLKI